MGNVVNGIIKAGSDLLNTLNDALTSALEYAWDDALVPVLETALATIGITDSDLLVTQILSQKMSQSDNLLKELLVSLAIEGTKSERTSINDIMDILASGKFKYKKYFSYGESEYIDGLPECTVRTSVLYTANVKKAIELDIGSSITTTEIFKKRPDYLEWSYWHLQTNYKYKLWTNTFMYQNISTKPIEYILNSIDTNENWNYYLVNATAYENKTTTISNITDITITAYDAEYDLQTTVVTKRTLIEGEYTGTISDTYKELSNSSVLIPIGSGSNFSNTEIISTTVVKIKYDTVELNIVEPLPQLYYVVKYYTTNPSQLYYWIYLIGEGEYITLESDDTYITNLELFPTVTIRNSGITISEDIDTIRYNDAKKMLKYLGISITDVISNIEASSSIEDVQDTFIHFGLCPNDTNEIVSKILYEMFNYILTNEDLLVVEGSKGSTTYSVIFKEDPMNIVLSWKHFPITTKVGTLPDSKTYHHYVSRGNLYLQKQITDTTYQTLVLDTLQNATVIQREGISGLCSLAPNDDNFFIPLSFYYVNQLSITEQVELLGISLRITSYAAKLIHLEWYETPVFKGWLEAIGYALLLYTGISGAWIKAFTLAIVAYGSAYALKKVFESTDNKFIRLLAITAAIAVTVYTGIKTSDSVLSAYELSLLTTSSLADFTSLMYSVDIQTLAEKDKILTSVYESTMDEYNDILKELNKNNYILETLVASDLPLTSDYKQNLDLYYYITKGDVYKNYDLVYSSVYDSVHNFYDNALSFKI